MILNTLVQSLRCIRSFGIGRQNSRISPESSLPAYIFCLDGGIASVAQSEGLDYGLAVPALSAFENLDRRVATHSDRITSSYIQNRSVFAA